LDFELIAIISHSTPKTQNTKYKTPNTIKQPLAAISYQPQAVSRRLLIADR